MDSNTKFYNEQLRNTLISLDSWVKVQNISNENIDKIEDYIKELSEKFDKDWKKEVKKHKDIIDFIVD